MRVDLRNAAKSALGRLRLLNVARDARNRLKASGFTPWKPLVPVDEFTNCASNAIAVLRDQGHEFGDYLEFGVSRGTSLACMWRALSDAGLREVRMIGFDSFSGLHPDAAQEGWAPGDFASSESATRRYLAGRGVPSKQFLLIKGWFRDTATARTRQAYNIRKASIVMVDCDAYTPSKEALWFIADLIVDQAVIIFDDWGSAVRHGIVGQREAFSEFQQAFPWFDAQPLPSYCESATVFLLTRRKAPA